MCASDPYVSAAAHRFPCKSANPMYGSKAPDSERHDVPLSMTKTPHRTTCTKAKPNVAAALLRTSLALRRNARRLEIEFRLRRLLLSPTKRCGKVGCQSARVSVPAQSVKM